MKDNDEANAITNTRRGVAPKTEIAVWLKTGMVYTDIANYLGCTEARVREVAHDMMKRDRRSQNA